jgi:glycosyltransferase involved in cell wall biosynthesis
MTERRKLLFYTHGLTSGGAERVVARLATGFAARGDHVLLAVDFEAQENSHLLSPKVDLRVLPRGHVQSTLALARLLRRESPDASISAISVSNLKHAVAAVIAGRINRSILTYHGFYLSEHERLSNIGYRLTPVLSRLAGATVAVSDQLRKDLIANFNAPADKVTTIHNPAAPEPFPDRLSLEELAARSPTVVSMGRLAPDKDYTTLLRAFARLPGSETRLVILGEGPERTKLQDEARALGVAERVSLPGFKRDIESELARARCFALSSRRETFSLACVEALAHGLPVVATDCGGPSEILGKHEFGALVPVGDVEGLAQAIKAALAQPGDPVPRQDRARDFSLDAALDAYDSVIRALG